MAGTVQPMYVLKPVQDPSAAFHYNTTMYAMKNLIDSTLSLQTGSNNTSDDTYDEVERTQAYIFECIKTIKKQVEELKQILLKRSGQTTEKPKVSNEMSSETSLNKSGVTHELVINADINNPPYSLLALHHLTKQIISIKITSHFHSSLSSLPENLKGFNGLSDNVNGNPTLSIRLIWKNGGGTSVVLGHVPLTGEVSLLRFVHASLNVKLNPSEDTELQQILDDINNSGVKSFESVKGTKHLVADKLTVADLALWSALKHTSNAKLQQWFQHFDKILTNRCLNNV